MHRGRRSPLYFFLPIELALGWCSWLKKVVFKVIISLLKWHGGQETEKRDNKGVRVHKEVGGQRTTRGGVGFFLHLLFNIGNLTACYPINNEDPSRRTIVI
jgi:hypothetical protein